MAKISNGPTLWRWLAFKYLRGAKGGKRPGSVSAISLRHGRLWAAATIAFIGLVFGFDIFFVAIKQCITLLFELVQGYLESLYTGMFKLELHRAQMATAYTGFVVLLGVGYFLFRKFRVILRELLVSWEAGSEKAGAFVDRHWQSVRARWDSMDGFDKCFAAVALVSLAVPVVTIVGVALGKMLTQII